MPKAFSTWTILPHKPIRQLADNLWLVVGDLPNMALKRTMTVARMDDGRLVIHNPIALEDEAMRELESVGKPAFIVVPNGWHRLDCAVFKQRYPGAALVCPAGSKKRVAEVVAVDATYEQLAGDRAVSLTHVAGLKDVEGVMTVRSSDGVTLVFNDLVFNIPHQPGLGGLFFRVLGSTGGPKVTRIMRLFAVKDRAAVRRHLEELAATPDLVRIVPGHGFVIEADAAATLRAIAARL